MPPNHASAGITTLQLFEAGVYGRCDSPGQHADHAADDGEQDRLTEELRPDLAPRCTEGTTEADLRAAFQSSLLHPWVVGWVGVHRGAALVDGFWA